MEGQADKICAESSEKRHKTKDYSQYEVFTELMVNCSLSEYEGILTDVSK
jgi:hypothetical protein